MTFLLSFAICIGLILLVLAAKKYNRYIDSGKENDDDLHLGI